jgi:acetyltransferase-like isoleucine patch superfamily enzyme
MANPRIIEGDWHDGAIPDNVLVDDGVFIESSFSFHRFSSRQEPGLHLGRGSSTYAQTLFDVGPQGSVAIGEYSLLNGVCITCDRQVTIGSHCLLSWNVVIMDTRRAPAGRIERIDLLRRAIEDDFHWPSSPVDPQPVTIGDNVWIGFDAVVMPGVSIGTGSVVGARSVAAADIPEYSIAVGNPARVIKRLPLSARN